MPSLIQHVCQINEEYFCIFLFFFLPKPSITTTKVKWWKCYVSCQKSIILEQHRDDLLALVVLNSYQPSMTSKNMELVYFMRAMKEEIIFRFPIVNANDLGNSVQKSSIYFTVKSERFVHCIFCFPWRFLFTKVIMTWIKPQNF